MKLTNEQIEEVLKERVAMRDAFPVRFLHDGRALNIETGALDKKGINVMHQLTYWAFNKETSRKIAKWLEVKAVY